MIPKTEERAMQVQQACACHLQLQSLWAVHESSTNLSDSHDDLSGGRQWKCNFTNYSARCRREDTKGEIQRGGYI